MTEDQILELKLCKNLSDLKKFVNIHIPCKTTYEKNFRIKWLKLTNPKALKRITFEDAYNMVWSFMLQQENPVYLGRTSDKCKIKLTAIHGMECHSK